jgi:hypothetical protein
MLKRSSGLEQLCRNLVPLMTVVILAGASRGGDLEKQLYRNAPQILEQLRKKGYQNVGILKFRVKKGDQVTANVGPLNLKVAQRLELALMLAHKGKGLKDPLGIVRDASSIANHLPGANHLTAEGREKLFTAEYPLAWGDKKVIPDAFLTGMVRLGDDLRQMKVGILVFDKKNKSLEKVTEFTAKTDTVSLIDSGESFLLRGIGRRGADKEPEEVALDAAVKVKKAEQTYPLADEDAPIDFEIRYDDRKVNVQIENGEARVPEPQEGQKMKLILRRKGDGKERYGMVVKVNGQNTLGKQQMPDSECRIWVLDPGDGPTVLEGFQIDDKTAEGFRVLAPEESKTRAMDYGADVGTITVTVFREQKNGGRSRPVADQTPQEEDEAEDLGALTRGIMSPKAPANLSALLAQVRASARRGIVVEGEQTKSDVLRVQFTRDPVPLMSATIRYFKP